MVCEVVHGPSILVDSRAEKKGHGRDSVQIGEPDGEECEAITAAFCADPPQFSHPISSPKLPVHLAPRVLMQPCTNRPALGIQNEM